ncbi:Bug family tripartite tricarboxylate transporter substrate binding protein [Falsiroseomonas oryziterrae]|uniref:Bug family tripartite tricarboxylate transporter substrate binding protein n=1 Tax=Falsiroseomonas oryziterrae TaxID=2911368 RepID=UPI001F1767E0|nr:tripartite tricarboxylate transporter substrate binding protein [Roseomonas sp. NPKOSM-4]
MRRRAVLAAPALLALPRSAAAQAWPERPVRVLVPFAAGGNTDQLARLTAEILTEGIPGGAFVVENRTGAGGLLALEALVRAPADGHTLMMASLSTLAISPFAAAQRPRFDPIGDIQPIVNLGTNPFVLYAHRSVDAADAAGLLAWMRARSGRFAFASGGVGSMGHLSMVLLLQRLGVEAEHVAYRGGAPALLDVIAGNVPVSFANLSEILPHRQNPAIRIHAISSRTRNAQAPEIPPLADALPDFETLTWNGLIGPAGLPAPIVARLHRIVADALQRPAVQARLAALGNDPLGEGPEAYARRLRADAALWQEVIRVANLRLD